MSYDYEIIASSDAQLILRDGRYPRRTPLCRLDALRSWLRANGNFHEFGTFDYSIATHPYGSARLSLITLEYLAVHGSQSLDVDVDTWPWPYVPKDDDSVTSIDFQVYNTFDSTLIARCAEWLGATIFDHQTTQLFSSEEALRLFRREP
jgi:hypothetical protein